MKLIVTCWHKTLTMSAKKLLSAAVLIGFFFGACSKDGNNTPNNSTPEKFQDLNVSSSFDWRTNQDVQLQIIGLPTVNTIERTLIVKNQDGETVYKQTWEMSESGSLSITLPKYMTELTVEYGSIEEQVEINSIGDAVFSFIPTVVDDTE